MELSVADYYTDLYESFKYNKEDIQNGGVRFSVGGRCDRGRNEYKEYAYISTKILQLI